MISALWYPGIPALQGGEDVKGTDCYSGVTACGDAKSCLAPVSGSAPQPQPAPQQQPPPPQTAQLQTPPTPNINNEFKKYGGSMSAGSAIQEAARGAAAKRASGPY